ncbi:hypothetical protein KXW38_008239, partial [Aspergillus fumigatus]
SFSALLSDPRASGIGAVALLLPCANYGRGTLRAAIEVYPSPCPMAVSPRGAPPGEAGRSNYSATPADPSVSIPRCDSRKIRPVAMPILLGQPGFTSRYPCKEEEQKKQTLGSCGKSAPSRACCIWH